MTNDPGNHGETFSDLTRAVADRIDETDHERGLLQAVIENIPAGLVVFDQDRTPLLVNGEALRICRKSDPTAFVGWHETEAYRLDGTPILPEERPISRTLATGEVVRGEVYELVLDGHNVILEISTAPVISPSGERSGALTVFRDVTIRERTERAERDFVTNAAHELQTPLAAIVSSIEVLQAGAKEGPQRDAFLGHIEREADRLARLVRALLILARTQIGAEAPRSELVALCPLLNEIASDLGVGSEIVVEVDCPQDLAVLTNRELLEQATLNLAENAAKHTPTGAVVLSARRLPDRLVEVAVADTGPGIAAPERSRVFERFYRADPNETPGFGLGLAIVQAAVEALEGELELDSTIGGGTTVRFRLPRAASMVDV